jgi:hypothetical protein
VCVGIAQVAVAGGSARKVGIIVASVVSAAAVVTFVLLAFVLPDGDAEAETRAFQSRVREICDDNRSLETQFNRSFTKLQRENAADLSTYISTWTDLVARFSYASRQLSDDLEALDAPSARADLHQEAVLTWQRLVRLMDGTVEVGGLASTPEEAAAAINDASGREQGDRLNTSRDALLRELAGTGCDPSLPTPALGELTAP